MRTLLPMFLIALMIATAAGCQKSPEDHNMSAAEHEKMK